MKKPITPWVKIPFTNQKARLFRHVYTGEGFLRSDMKVVTHKKENGFLPVEEE